MFVLLLMVMSRSLLVSTMDSEDYCESLGQHSEVTIYNQIKDDDFYLWYKVAAEDTQINMTVYRHLKDNLVVLLPQKTGPFKSSNTEYFIRIRLYYDMDRERSFVTSKNFAWDVSGRATITKVMVESNASVEWIKCLNHYSFPSLSSYNPGDSPAFNKSTVLLVVLSVLLLLALVTAAYFCYLWRTKTKAAPLPAAVGDGSSREVNDDDEHLYEDWNDDVISPRSHTSRNSLYVSADEQTATVSAIKTEEQLE
ncbi:uncharacterized protein LOC121859709 isoform X2 [Homarus americanus]|uniref:uncharacterized protein LOC121859709 isoform X2 n=1 Tax=Homarus americanus TaxID=6706 RepID=UPI001C43EB79|nr:uncharacterized protein LOC121859709 isoform X2 [Homarus americanus]